jgi:hypothetical protein
MDRMYCYLWHQKSEPDKCKFGERFVFEGEDPEVECRKRIRESLGVQKYKYDNGDVVVDAIWDVTEYARAQCPDRVKNHGRVDDYIRNIVGFRNELGREIHDLEADVMAYKVNELLKKAGQPLPEVGITQNQYDAAENVLEAMAEGKKTIVAELCARFGKTIWSGVLIRETGVDLAIVASYVLTSFASFKKDLTSFEQFRDLVLVEAGEDDWEQTVTTAVEQGKQTVVFLSMCAGGRRQDKIDFLFNVVATRMMLVDEADFGVHQLGQSRPLIEARSEDDVVILMTGTNGDKATSIWPVDHYLSVTYPELLIEKHRDRLVDAA